jgi:hypothetical protein
VLRVLGFDDDGEPAALAADATEKASASALVEMSRLLMQAHDAGAQRHAQAYEIAYANQTALLGVIASRLVGLETAWGKAMNALAVANADLAQVSAAEDGDPAGQAIGMLLARAFGTPPAPAGAPAAPPAKNGKKEAS